MPWNRLTHWRALARSPASPHNVEIRAWKTLTVTRRRDERQGRYWADARFWTCVLLGVRDPAPYARTPTHAVDGRLRRVHRWQSRHGEPIRIRHRIPSISWRLSHFGGRPVDDAAGSSGASTAHCASGRSCPRAGAPVCRLYRRVYRLLARRPSSETRMGVGHTLACRSWTLGRLPTDLSGQSMPSMMRKSRSTPSERAISASW